MNGAEFFAFDLRLTNKIQTETCRRRSDSAGISLAPPTHTHWCRERSAFLYKNVMHTYAYVHMQVYTYSSVTASILVMHSFPMHSTRRFKFRARILEDDFLILNTPFKQGASLQRHMNPAVIVS